MLKIFPRSVFHLVIGSATIFSLLVSMCGCDQISGTQIVQVNGEVRMDRKPLADTMVAFIPLEPLGANGKITELAFGQTDDAGRFELRTSEARGVLPGEYRVLFFRSAPESDSPPRPDGGLLNVELQNSIKGIASETSLMLAAIDKFDPSAAQMVNRPATVNTGGVPAAYNHQSELRLTVKRGAGIIYPKFELDAHPKN